MQRHYLNYGKLGQNDLYSFYVPYHLTIFEVALSVARVALFKDTIIAPTGAPKVEVVATAKIDLKAGSTLDGIGEYMTYGQCETATITQSEQLLPMGIAEGAVLTKDIKKDQVITMSDVTLTDNQSVQLRLQQNKHFS